MDNGASKVPSESPRPIKRFAPRPRSLHVHGFFSQPATKVGMVATKAYFKLLEFMLREITLTVPTKETTEEQKITGNEQDKTRLDNLKNVIKRSREVLASAKTVFPFTLFPDKITVDRTKVTIHRNGFFFSSDMLSIRIEDILNVGCGVGPLFGSITITSRVMSTADHFTISFFWRKDAVHLKHILQGYVIAMHNRLDVMHLEKDELIATLEDLGHDASG